MVLGGKLPLYNLSGYNRDSGFRGLGLGLRGWFLMGYSYIHIHIYILYRPRSILYQSVDIITVLGSASLCCVVRKYTIASTFGCSAVVLDSVKKLGKVDPSKIGYRF